MTDLKIREEREYAGVAGQLETITLIGDNTDNDRDAVRATMEFQAEQGSRIRTLHAALVRKMPAPKPVHQAPIPAGLGAGQNQGGKGGAGKERPKLKLKPQEIPRFNGSARTRQFHPSSTVV